LKKSAVNDLFYINPAAMPDPIVDGSEKTNQQVFISTSSNHIENLGCPYQADFA
jgi:hypothetical protein